MVRAAACYYLSDRARRRPGWHYPRFRAADTGSTALVLMPPEIGAAIAIAFTREADRQGVACGRLLRHALLYYLADLHSGEVARRILADLQAAP